MNTIPTNLKYTEDHEWVKIEGNIATIGITNFAQRELGDIVFVDVDTIDETLDAGQIFGSIEAVKTVSDLFLPLTGTILELNEEIENNPELINSSPYEEGWLIKMEITDENTALSLLTPEAYATLIGE